MAPITNTRLLFNEIPTGYPEPGKATVVDHSETIDVDTVSLNGGVLAKVLALSIDPYQRGRMRDAKIWSYMPAYKIGQPLEGYGVGHVLRSENPNIKAGDHIYGMFPFAEYHIFKELPFLRTITPDSRIPLTAYVGVLGMPGQTAYYAWKEFAKAQKGETAFVSGGAGAVGAVVIQLAKRDGMKVIASAGSEAKVAFMKEAGADVAFNYKTNSTLKILEKEGPLDVYWDNVGGETLDAALATAVVHARFIECGMIAGYNEKTSGLKNAFLIAAKRLHVQGVFVDDPVLTKHKNEFYEIMPKLVSAGEIKYTEHVYHGLESAGQAILDVQTGKNEGKAVIVLAEE